MSRSHKLLKWIGRGKDLSSVYLYSRLHLGLSRESTRFLLKELHRKGWLRIIGFQRAEARFEVD